MVKMTWRIGKVPKIFKDPSQRVLLVWRSPPSGFLWTLRPEPSCNERPDLAEVFAVDSAVHCKPWRLAPCACAGPLTHPGSCASSYSTAHPNQVARPAAITHRPSPHARVELEAHSTSQLWRWDAESPAPAHDAPPKPWTLNISTLNPKPYVYLFR